MTYIYEPSSGLRARVSRRLTPFRGRKMMTLKPGKTIVSFSFDDCPVSGIENGVKVLEQEGWLSTVYAATGLFGTENHLGQLMDNDDAQALHKSGHEIGEHSFSHQDANSMGLADMLRDIDRNQEALNALGLPQSETIAYPFGETNPGLKAEMADRFKGARGIQNKLHRHQVDLNQIGSLPLFTDKLEDSIDAIKSIGRSGGWLTFFTHDVRDNPSNWGCTPEVLSTIIKTVKDSGADVLSIKDAITALGVAA